MNKPKTFYKEYQKIKSLIPNTKLVRAFDELKRILGGRPLVLYGAGWYSGLYLEYCMEQGLDVTCIGDTYKTGRHECGLPIVDMPTLVAKYPDAIILISSPKFYDEIYLSLTQRWMVGERLFQYPPELVTQLRAWRFERKHRDGYAWAYSFFSDEPSRQMIMERVRMYLLEEQPNPNSDSEVYYECGYISLVKNEVFVDAGARNGDTVESFLAKMKDARMPWRRIYAFEPSWESCKEARLRLNDRNDVEIIQMGLWSCETTLPFFVSSQHSGANSFILQDGEGIPLPLTSLDIFFRNKPGSEWPTFIKMDIEGSEKEALIGSTEIIRRVKPKLAICSYHKAEDLYELPRTIMDIRDDYKFALRTHAPSGIPNELILYAV